MRTIKEIFAKRLKAQAKEAEVQGLTKIASSLNEVVNEQVIRDNKSSYTYSKDSFSNDIEQLLWKAAIRAADFYDANLDVAKAHKMIESMASEFIEEMKVIVGSENGVGAYEPNVPGEISKTVMIEIDDE